MVIDLDTNKYKAVDPERVVGAKSGDKPRKPVIADDSVASISTAKILYGLSEGEISGIVGNAKGIYLENTPLQDDSGNNNFENVVYDFRSGTVDQTYIKGFPDVSNELPVNVELKSTTAWIKAINKTELSAVRIRLAWNGLKSQNLDNGDVSGYKIEYAVDVKTDTGAYVEVLKTFINDKVSGKYERTHRIDLPKASTGWQIRVRRLTANQNKENIVDKMFVESITEVIDIKLRYPNTALLGLQYDAKTFSRIAKIAVRARGKLISIPTNYDTTTGKYVGLWNGTFKQVYSNNPAWIFYDIVTSKRYGLGKRIDKSMLDKWSIYSLGVYCDELIADGEGGLEKRFTCNVYLQSQADAFKVLQQLSGIFRSLSYWNGEQIVLDADVPKDPVYTFSRANVVDGNFEYSGTRARDRHTVAKVAFDNPNEGYKTEYEYIRDEAAIAKFGINIVDISAIGCTSRAQAQRAGLWALKSEQLETRTVTFRTGLEGFIPQVGNIIEVSDELLAGRANGGRIASVSDNGKVVTLDREITVAIDDFIIVNGKDGISQKRKVINVSGKLVTVSAAFENIESGAVYAIRAVDLDTMKFRVMTIKPDDSNVFSITALQHEPLKYNAIDYGTDVKPTNISNRIPTSIEAPKTVSLSSTNRVVQGQNITTLTIQWSQVKEAVAYSVEWRRDNGNWIKAPITGNVSLDIEGVYEGNYIARVSAINAFDVASLPTTSMLTNIKGKVGKPKALGFIKATGVLFGMEITWGFNTGSEDTSYTEIQLATDALGTNTALLGMFSYPTDRTEVTGLQGGLTVFYRGRTVDKLGNSSDWSAWVSGTTDNSADKVLELLNGEITESQLNQSLTTKIDKIDSNSDSIGGINTEVDKAKADIIEANNIIAANKLEAANAVAAANTEIEASRTELNTAKTQLATAITNINTANTKIADSKLLIDANKAKLVLTDAEVAAAKTKVTALETDYNGNKTSVSNALTVLTNKDKSLASDISTLTANYGASEAKLVQDLKVLADKDVALTNSVTTLSSSYEANKAKVAIDITSLVNKDTALNNLLTTLDSDYKTNKASVSNSLTTLTNKDTALASDISKLNTKTDNTNAEIVTVKNLVSDNTSSIANTKTELTTAYKQAIDDIKVGGRNLLLYSSIGSFVGSSNYKPLSNSLYEIIGSKINIKNTVRDLVGFDVINLEGITEITISVYSNLPYVRTYFSFDVSGQQTTVFKAEGNNFHTLNMKVPEGAKKLDIGIGVFPYPSVFEPYYLDRLQAEEGNIATAWNKAPEDVEAEITAAIQVESTARSNAIESVANTVTALDTDYKGNKTAIRNELTAVSTKTDSTANSLTSLTTEVGKNKTAITTEATTRSTEDTALSNRITTVSGKTDNALSRITTAETTIANNTGAITQQKTDITAEYKQAIEDIEVGGRNLLLDSKKPTYGNTDTGGITNNVTEDYAFLTSTHAYANIYNYFLTQITEDLIAGNEYTFSIEINSNDVWGIYHRAIGLGDFNLPNTDGKWVTIKKVFTPSENHLKTTKYISGFHTIKLGSEYKYRNLKIEKGNIATAWTQAPEEIEANITAAITRESTARTSAVEAVANTVTALDSRFEGNKATVSDSLTTLTNKDTSLANSITALTTTVGNNTTAISTESTARSTADTAIGNRITTVEGKTDNALARVTTVETIAADNKSSIASTKTDLIAKFNEAKDYSNLKSSIFVINGNTKKFINPISYSNDSPNLVGYLIIETPITPDRMVNIKLSGYNYSTQSTISLNVGFYNYGGAFINASYESLGRYKIDKLQLAKKTSDNRAVIIIGLSTSVWEYPKIVVEEAIVGYSWSDDSYLNGFNMSINSDISAYHSVVAISGVDLQGTLQENSAAITAESTARVNSINSLANTVTALNTDYNGNKANVSNSLTALSNADSALGNRISNTEAVANNAQARVGTVETAVATNTGAIAQTTNKISAAIAAIEVGGRNFLANSADVTLDNSDYGNGGLTIHHAQGYKSIKANANGNVYGYLATTSQMDVGLYTFSMEVNTTYSTSMYFRIGGVGDGAIQIPNTGGTWRKITHTYTGSYRGINENFLLGFTNLVANASIYFRGLKVEKGNTASDWTPAPEDVIKDVAAIEVKATATANKVTGLEAQYTVKLDVGGRVSGFGLASSTTYSDFAVNADRFYIAPPSGSSKGTSPFMVLTTPTNINGTIVPSGTYMRSAFIHDGSIDNAKIGYAAIDNAKIKDLAITTGKIGFAQVDTLQIKGQAVSISSAVSKNKPSNLAEWCKGNGTVNEVSTIFEEISVDSGGASVILELYFYGTFVNVTNGSLTGSRVMIEFYGRDDSGNITQVQYFRFYRNYEELSTGFKAQFYPPNRNMNYYAKISCFGVSRMDSASYTFSVMTLKK